MTNAFYVGDYKRDGLNGANNGWIVGTFVDSEPRKNEAVEIKYWEYSAGDTAKQYLKTSAIIECTFILKGSTKCLVDDQEIILNAGDYVVIKPGTPNNTVAEILEDVIGLTIKAPSDPSAKKIVKQNDK